MANSKKLINLFLYINFSFLTIFYINRYLGIFKFSTKYPIFIEALVFYGFVFAPIFSSYSLKDVSLFDELTTIAKKKESTVPVKGIDTFLALFSIALSIVFATLFYQEVASIVR